MKKIYEQIASAADCATRCMAAGNFWAAGVFAARAWLLHFALRLAR